MKTIFIFFSVFVTIFAFGQINEPSYIDYTKCEEFPSCNKDFVKEITKCFKSFEEERVIEVSFFVAKDGNTFSPVADVPGYADCIKKALEKCGSFSPCYVNGKASYCIVKFKINIKIQE